MYSWLLVLVFLMARGGPGAKRRRPSAQEPADDAGSEYRPGDDSGAESQDEDWDAIATEIRSKKKENDKGKGKEKVQDTGKGKEKTKGKEKSKSKGKDKGKGKEKVVDTGETGTPTTPHTYVRGHRGSEGVSIHERDEDRARDPPIDARRRDLYCSKTCIGERFVGVANLFEKVPGFQAPFEHGDLHEVCNFAEQTGYGLELIREFYMRAGHLLESDEGPHVFMTSVRGVEMSITPATIATVLGMEARTDGIDYLHSGFGAIGDWTRFLRFLCVPGAENNGNAILSKDLRLEWRFLNFVVCYNVMPLANTKIIRWDRVLYLYLLGHPEIVQQRKINLNVPFLIWKRMAREIKTSSKKDRLPYPLLIMRILRLHEVRIVCSSYEYSLGPIGEMTMAKSRAQLHPDAPPPAPAPAPPSPPPAAQDDVASMSSIFSEQQRLSGELERQGTVQADLRQDMAKLKRRNSRISQYLRLLCEKMGCGAAEMPPPDTDSD